MRLPKSHKLVNKVDYKNTFNQPFKISHKHLLILFKPNKLTHARLGLIVGKRVATLAVTRNRIKRTIRESFRAHQERLKCLDIVVMARQGCDTQDKIELRKRLDSLWEKLIIQYRKLLSS